MNKRDQLRTAHQLVDLLDQHLTFDSPPLDLRDKISEIALLEGISQNLDEAQELVDLLIDQIRSRAVEKRDEAEDRGITWKVEVFGSSNEWVRGASHTDLSLGNQVNEMRSRRAHVESVKLEIQGLTDYQFEQLCTSVLKDLGCENPRTSWRSKDGGIDFYGRLSFQGRLDSKLPLGGFDRGAGVWLIGQAKHFRHGPIGTAVIREMVGSVELARTGSALRSWPDLDLRPFDPILMLVFTTGKISRDSRQLLALSGMLSMDGDQLSTYLCDSGFGFSLVDGSFNATIFLQQIVDNSNPVQ